MTEQEIRKIIKEEMNSTFAYIFNKHITLGDGRNIITGRTTGTKIGTAIDQLLGFYGKTPVDQPITVADPSGGTTQDLECRARLVEVIDRLQELGLIA